MSKRAAKEMTLEEARAYRASLYVPKKRVLSLAEKREQFKLFWAKTKKKYSTKTPNIEKILWLHLLAIECDEPENFEKGLKNFGLKKS